MNTRRTPEIPPERDTSWRAQAACQWHDPEIFFPQSYQESHEAKRICASCPVVNECFLYALSVPTQSDHGVYGGTTPMQRTALRHSHGKHIARISR